MCVDDVPSSSSRYQRYFQQQSTASTTSRFGLPTMFYSCVIFAAFLVSFSNSECANGCHGHGRCTAYDMCICWRNWQAVDCSERVCAFGPAHVDVPKVSIPITFPLHSSQSCTFFSLPSKSQGDLDGSGHYSGIAEIIAENHYVFQYGTTELFPMMKDSDEIYLDNTAHAYAECSNKGVCNRVTGECDCFDGFDGVACQRASCPGYPVVCSGHGVCKSAKDLARSDGNNDYKLWDKDSSMGCECDPGYTGADCSERMCKYGIDPLYFDDAATVKFPIYDFAILSTSMTATDLSDVFYGTEYNHEQAYWGIRFYDNFNDDWVTQPIPTGATCEEVIAALEALPQRVIPKDTVRCTKIEFFQGLENNYTLTNAFYDSDHDLSDDPRKPYRLVYKMAMWEALTPLYWGSDGSPAMGSVNFTSSNSSSTVRLSGYIYRLKFFGNPGGPKSPEIDLYLDGRKPSVVSPGAKVIAKVWTDGQQGENIDFFADHCDGVTVNIGTHNVQHTDQDIDNVDFGFKPVSYLTGFTKIEKDKLKACLGDADLDKNNNQDIYNWDKGSIHYPHLIKLVRTVTTYTDGGYYAAVYYDPEHAWDDGDFEGTFRLLNPFRPPDALSTDRYDVYTTKGTFAVTSIHAQATFGFGTNFFYTVNTTHDTDRDDGYEYDGDVSCYSGKFNQEKFKYIHRGTVSNPVLGGESSYVYHCLKKGDYFVPLSFEYPFSNPPNINLYKAMKVMKYEPKHSNFERYPMADVDGKQDSRMFTNMIVSDIASNWAAAVGNNRRVDKRGDSTISFEPAMAKFRIYQFIPAEESNYEYVAECSNRGKCNRDTGVCQCFPGYTKDNCAEQTTIVM